ncbi:MAG: saccharopine dehydrogenase family protein [Halobacteriales archaeon]
MTIHINGAGLMGRAIGYDLVNHSKEDIVFVDADETTLATAADFVDGDQVTTTTVDIASRSAYGEFLKAEAPELVINALPHELSVPALTSIVDTGIDAIDLAFEEEQRELAETASEQDVTMITGCGVAPGISNMLAGDGIYRVDEPESASIKVGGIPADPQPPLEYRVVFHLNSVWNAYTRPATIVRDGERIEVPPLSGTESVRFEGVGELECFYTDGLGTLPYTFDTVPNLEEKTIRYPGHSMKAKTLRECGLLDETPMEINGMEISPREFLTELLTPDLYLGDEEDLTVLRVEVENNAGERYEASMVDRYDTDTDMTSMARTTGFTASIVAQKLLAGRIEDTGLVAPETLAADQGLLSAIFDELAARGIEIDRSGPGT